MDELIAYQTVDEENDIWCNKAFLFDTQEKADEFFKDKMKVFNALGYELEGNETEEDITYNDKSENHKELICTYGGKTTILRMYGGIYIK